MNSGVGDAIDLAWKLDGTLRGWGGPQLLASYESRAAPDRRPQRRRVALRVARTAQVARAVPAEHSRADRRGPGDARQAGARGDGRAAQEQRDDRRRARLSLRRLAAHLGRARRARALFREYVPTTWPGARLPHVWLANGTADPGSHRRRLHAAAARAAPGRHVRRWSGDARAYGAPFADRHRRRRRRARCLWLRPHPAAAGPARRVARQRAPPDPQQLAALVTGH